jgi:Ribonuclease G/E
VIYDKDDMNGVTIHGQAAEKIVDVLKKELNDAFFWKMETGTIYCGKIDDVDSDEKIIAVDIGKDKKGLLSMKSFWGILKKGEKVLVQIKSDTRDGYMLSTKLRLFGNNVILIKGGFTKVSKHVRNGKERNRLLSISEDAKEKGWGVLWKVLAEKKSDEELKKEIEELIGEEEKIKKSFEGSKDVGLIKPGLSIYFADFGLKSKEKLDKIRSSVKSTITGHHSLKSAGMSMLAEYADSIMASTRTIDGKKLKNLMDDVIMDAIKANKYYNILQKKEGGREIRCKGIVIENKKGVIKVRRTMRPGGEYDGLGLPIEEGDYSITTVKTRDNCVMHQYFNMDSNEKGRYYSICTDIETFPEFSRCMDLEIDVVEKEGKKELVDKDLLESSKWIPDKMKKDALKIANQIVKEGLKW